MSTMNMTIPTEVLFYEEFFPACEGYKPEPHRVLCGKVLALFLDSGGEMHCAFECADMQGVYVISLGSTFFLGWGHP